MNTREAIEAMLERIRPALQADGGDIELIGLDGDIVRIRMTGACAGCPSANVTLQAGIEVALRRVRPQLRVVPVM
jgi:Fe-S cluster biogenesis protein NfuA